MPQIEAIVDDRFLQRECQCSRSVDGFVGAEQGA